MEESDSEEETPRPATCREVTARDQTPVVNPPDQRQDSAAAVRDDHQATVTLKEESDTSRRISEHVKDAKERFRLAMKNDNQRASSLRQSDSNDKIEQRIPTPRGSVRLSSKSTTLRGQLEIFRGNLRTENRPITLKDIPQLDLKSDNEQVKSAQRNLFKRSATFTTSDESLRLDLNPNHGRLSRRKSSASATLLSAGHGSKNNPDDENENNDPPLTPRHTPRSMRRKERGYIPTPRKSEDRLPMLSLSAKEDLIKEIAPGLLLNSKDSALSSSRSSVASSASSVQSSVTSVISLTELKTLRVNCRVSEDAIVSTATATNNSNNGVTSVITSNMSVTDMKRVLLGRSRVRGVEPANFCVIAVRTCKIVADGVDAASASAIDYDDDDDAVAYVVAVVVAAGVDAASASAVDYDDNDDDDGDDDGHDDAVAYVVAVVIAAGVDAASASAIDYDDDDDAVAYVVTIVVAAGVDAASASAIDYDDDDDTIRAVFVEICLSIISFEYMERRDTVACESALRSAGTLLSQVLAEGLKA
ncbi:hypothetical protein PoB_002634800 [Plakobranchus ocellatus]|uniref:Uncharacterized protein n=1 Tax=Plakobranchus ocellatus TaxID=259542 RepID=A0AAV3ZY73_9GAST|nr:hypothetical protein PoB_002634800 [Plakobranchus ocellatus]